MPVKLSQLKSPSKELDITYENGQVLKIRYKPSVLTPAYADRMAEIEKSGRMGKSQIESLMDILEWWDMTDEGGEPLAISEEVLMEMEFKVIRPIAEGIFNDIVPNAPTGTQ